MSKYNALWEYVQKNHSPSIKLSFDEIHNIAGTFVDRHDRRGVLITVDAISGITIIIIGIAAITDLLQVWMIFISSIIVGV